MCRCVVTGRRQSAVMQSAFPVCLMPGRSPTAACLLWMLSTSTKLLTNILVLRASCRPGLSGHKPLLLLPHCLVLHLCHCSTLACPALPQTALHCPLHPQFFIRKGPVLPDQPCSQVHCPVSQSCLLYAALSLPSGHALGMLLLITVLLSPNSDMSLQGLSVRAGMPNSWSSIRPR